ncbi:phage tail protein [Neobacillus niacini]|uniref:phage tail protein n=1 Tax=Neobacillus niacini TaxID=86668 RepID=UPI002860DEDD|nr:phage tail protein [Neobacillus niacini]MDR7001551.1 hypothetical protein [Neobacillus niacini]
MATTNLGLPLIAGNTSADVVRDMNALANGVDGKVGVASGIATLGADGILVPAQRPPIPTVNDASTTQKGIVQLTDSISSTSITTAATPNSVKTVYDTAVLKYTKPGAGIPKTDLDANVQASLNKVNDLEILYWMGAI